MSVWERLRLQLSPRHRQATIHCLRCGWVTEDSKWIQGRVVADLPLCLACRSRGIG